MRELPEYTYRCVDRSLLLPWFRERWVRPFAGWLPFRLTANLVTLGASACMWAVLALVVAGQALPRAALAIAFTLLVQAYLVYDHADGLHAERTGTSSALGEYIDHGLDAYHGPIVVLAFFALVGFSNRALVLVLLWCLHLAFAATMIEQKARGELRLGPLGSLEGILIFCAFFLSWLAPPFRAFWLAPLVVGVPAYALAVLAGVAGTGGTVLGCARRMGGQSWPVALFGFAGLALAVVLALGPLPLWTAIACLLMYAGDHTGRVIGSHLLGRRQPLPDPVAPVAAVFALVPGVPRTWATAGLLAYLALRTLQGVASVLGPLRSLWRWTNSAQLAS